MSKNIFDGIDKNVEKAIEQESAEIDSVLQRLEDSIFERRAAYRGKKMWFSFWLYEKRVKEYRLRWKKETADKKELAEKRVSDIIMQERINLDECRQGGAEAERSKRALWEAQDLQEALYYSYF